MTDSQREGQQDWGQAELIECTSSSSGLGKTGAHALEQRRLDSLFSVEWLAEGARPLLLSSHTRKIPVSAGPAMLSPPHQRLPLLPLQRTQRGASSLEDDMEFQTLGRELRQEMLFWSPGKPKGKGCQGLKCRPKDALTQRPLYRAGL